VVYTSGPKLKALHLVASSVEEHDLWYKTLKKLRQYRKEVTGGLAFLMSPERKLNPEKSVRVIRRHWREAGGIGRETAEVGFAEVERLCWKLNVHLSSSYLKGKFDVCSSYDSADQKQADSGHRGRLNFEQFQDFVRLLKEREEILALFKEYSGDSPVLSKLQFEDFLVKEQHVQYTPAELTKHYTKFSAKKLPGQTSVEGMDADGFLAYLLSKENRILDAPDLSDASVVAEKDSARDMTHPLNEYFISSSHNTYLMGRQLVGESSIEGYIRVLQLGCRCVEIDCWDGVDGWPVVEHGRTLYAQSSVRC
jgi:phosphatidylinositol phospholipase C, delta